MADTLLASGEQQMNPTMIPAHKHLTTLQRQVLQLLTAIKYTKPDMELVLAQIFYSSYSASRVLKKLQ